MVQETNHLTGEPSRRGGIVAGAVTVALAWATSWAVRPACIHQRA